MNHTLLIKPIRLKEFLCINYLLLIIFLFVFLLFCGVGYGKTITVDDDGMADFETIQDAINAAEDTDTIRVFEGYYEENVVVNKSVTVIGNGSENTTIYGGSNKIPVHIISDRSIFSGFSVTAHEFSALSLFTPHNLNII